MENTVFGLTEQQITEFGLTWGIGGFILLMLFHFSVALSLTQHKLAQIARELALAEERLRRLEPGPGQEGTRSA